MERIWLVVILAACTNGGATPQQAPSGTEPRPPVAALPSAAGSAAQVGKADPTPSEASKLFGTLCAQCHGADAKGYKADRAPSLVNPTFLESASDDYLRRSIERGRPGTSMAAYAKELGGPLTPEAVTQIVAWLRAKGPPARDLPPVASGNAPRGDKLYAEHCQKCHGDRQTRGEYLMLANPHFLDVASDGFVLHAIANGRPGTPMPAFGGKLGAQDIVDVVAHVRSLQQPLEIGRLPAPTGKEPLFINPKGAPPKFKAKDGRFVAAADVNAALVGKRKLVIIDARPESDWMTSHITGAVSIPHYQTKRLSEIPKNAWVVAYCACPHHLSGLVVDELRKAGRPNAFILDEGVLEWQRRNYPMVIAPGAPTPPAAPHVHE